MSENINNREYRKNVIKEVIKQLHEGKSVEEVREQFETAFAGVSATEISEAEGALIAEGLPISEVQRLCDVHAAVFKGSIEEIHQEDDVSKIPGHPANTLVRENRKLEWIISSHISPYVEDIQRTENQEALKEGLKLLEGIGLHYKKKENILFPYMEKYGITAPPQVMWGVDDEIREQLKESMNILENDKNFEKKQKAIEELITRIEEMIFKEENIMLPMLKDILTQEEWKKIALDSHEIGFIVDKIPQWNPTLESKKTVESEKREPGIITLPTGIFKTEELTQMLNTLPFDITFVDKNDVVKYFSQSSERIFPRTKSVIGRNVSNCHPPASVHIVEQIVSDFKTGKKEHEDFYIKMGDKYILIRYFAVRDEKGEYMGVVEVTQNIKPIQEITGEKRLVSME